MWQFVNVICASSDVTRFRPINFSLCLDNGAIFQFFGFHGMLVTLSSKRLQHNYYNGNYTGRSPVGRRATGVAHNKIARVACVVFVLYCMWMNVLPSLQFLTVTKCTETKVPSEPLYRTILPFPLPLYPLTLYPLSFNPLTLYMNTFISDNCYSGKKNTFFWCFR